MATQVDGSKVTLDSGLNVVMPFPIKSFVDVENLVIVCLEVPPEITMTENVFAINRNGKVEWTIQRIPQTATDPVNTYMGLILRNDGSVQANNWNGGIVDIDVHTGKVLRTAFGK